jgi:hypothetical protein
MSENILNRVKLLMEYDNSRTYSENELIVEQNLEYDKYYKKYYLSKKRQDELFNSVGVPESNKPNMGIFRVVTEDQWYAVYAVWFAQEVEFKVAEKWGWFPEGKCPKSWKTPGRESCKSGNLIKRLDYNKKSTTSYNVTTICYNEDIAYYKPYDNITFDSGIDSSSGLLNRNSIKRYTGHIPSYADVVVCYGPNYIDVINKINASPKSAFVNRNAAGMGKGQQSVSAKSLEYKTGLTSDELHNILAVLELGTAFIPVAGPVISAAIGSVDAAIYYGEGDKDMGVFMLLVTLLPELKIASNITKSAKLMKGQKMVEKKILSGKPLKNLTIFEIEFIESLKTLNPSKLNSELKESIARRADNILQTQGEKLTEQQKAYLKDYSKIYQTEYFALDLLVTAAAVSQTNVGKELLKKLSGLFVKNKMELTKETADEIVKALAQLDNNEQNTMVDAMGENNKEFVAFANNPTEVTTELKKRIKTKGTRKEKITKTEMNDLLSTIPDDFD